MTLKVTLINFGDSPRVFYDANTKPKHVIPGGVIKDFEMTERGVARVKRDETMVVMNAALVDRQQSGLLSGLLGTLADWGTLSMEEKQTRTERVFGVGALGLRPTDYEMRHALAVRAKEAAHYIQLGSFDTADEVLGAKLPSREEQLKKIADAKAAAKANDPMIVRGDDEETEGDNGSNDRQPTRTLEPVSDDERSSGTIDRSGAAQLVPASDGPGFTVPARGGETDDRPVPTAKPQRQIRRRRLEPEPAQPVRAKRIKNPPRVVKKTR